MSQMKPPAVEALAGAVPAGAAPAGVPHTRTQSTSIVAGKKERSSGAPAHLPPTATLLRGAGRARARTSRQRAVLHARHTLSSLHSPPSKLTR